MLAALASLLVNALVASMVLSLSRPRPPQYRPTRTSNDVVLVVDFVSVLRTRDPEPARHSRRAAPSAGSDRPFERGQSSTPTRARREVRTKAADSEQSASPATSVPGGKAVTAAFVEQARDWARHHAPAEVQAAPFANRIAALPGRPAQTFRMHDPLSPADVVARIGVLFGADGVTSCTGIEDRIAGYATSGSRAALQEAIDYEKRRCRP